MLVLVVLLLLLSMSDLGIGIHAIDVGVIGVVGIGERLFIVEK